MATWDSTAFCAEVRRRAAAPASSASAPGWQNSDLISMANGELPEVAKRLRRVRTGYFRVQEDQAFTSGVASYRFPTRTMHGVISMAQRLDAAGVLQPLAKWTEGDLSGRNPTTAGDPEAYVIRGNSLVLYPVPNTTAQSLRFTYPRRPNQLAAVSTIAVLSSITYPSDATKVTLNLTADASTYGITASTPVDLIRARVPFDSLLDSSTPYTVVAAAVGLQPGAAVVAALRADAASSGAGSLGGLYAGDYVCLAGTAPVFQMPTEAFYVLAQRVANMLMVEDPSALRTGERLLAALEADLYGGAEDRDDAEPDVVASDIWP